MEYTHSLNLIRIGMENERTEIEIQISLLKYLSKYFFVYPEVWSTDGKRRIDIIAIHKSDELRIYPIGIEVKRDVKKRGKDLAAWLIQSSDYSTKNFIGFGKCLIITAPQVSGTYLNEGKDMHQHLDEFLNPSKDNNIATFLGQFKIGEMQKYVFVDYKSKSQSTHYRFVYLGQKIWDSRDDDFRFNNYERLCKR